MTMHLTTIVVVVPTIIIFLEYDRMIADHMNPEYKRALALIATQMKGVNGIDGYTFPSRYVR
jgi:hypothetical protein